MNGWQVSTNPVGNPVLSPARVKLNMWTGGNIARIGTQIAF